MKTNMRRGVVCALAISPLLIGLFLVSKGDAESKALAIGKISYVQGDVFRSDAQEGPFKRVLENYEVFEGDFLKTESDARFEARLNDRSVIRLGPSSQMKLETAKFSKKNEGQKQVSAKLIVGRIWANVTKLFGDSKFEVSTTTAVAGVRGTSFAVDQSADKTTTVRVFTGKVLVSNKPVYYKEGNKKGERVQVQGPQEVTKKQWEESVAGALQQISVAANGDMTSPAAFVAAEAAKDDWVAWNRGRDGDKKED